MKIIFTILAALVLAGTGSAGQRVDAAAWRNVQTYDVPTVLKESPSLIGRVVAVTFHYRSEKLRHLQPNWYEASLWQHDPNAKNGYSAFRVMVAKKDVPAFKTITSDFHSFTKETIYGRVEKDPDNNLTHLRALGRKVKTDAAGNATVDW